MNKVTKRLTKKDVLTVPNAMSLARLLLIPFIVRAYAFRGDYALAAVLVVISWITDVLDGFVARRFHMVSDLGKFLDPVADKQTQMAVLVCLCVRYSKLRLVIFAFVVRELVLFILGVLTLRYTDTVNGAHWYGKVTTFILEASAFVLLLFPDLPAAAADALAYLCLFAILGAFILYVGFFMRALGGVVHRLLEGKWASRIAIGLTALLWAAMVAVFLLNRDSFTVDSIVDGSPDNMILSALMMLALFALKSISIVLYSGVLYITSGILFPLPVAILVNLLGTVVMLTVPFLLGRLMGRRALEHIHEKYPKAAFLEELRSGGDFMFSLIVHLVNILPIDLVSIYMGADGLGYLPYITGGTLGLLVMAVLFPITGRSITRPTSPEFIISVALEIAVTLVSAGVHEYIRRKRNKKRGS